MSLAKICSVLFQKVPWAFRNKTDSFPKIDNQGDGQLLLDMTHDISIATDTRKTAMSGRYIAVHWEPKSFFNFFYLGKCHP